MAMEILNDLTIAARRAYGRFSFESPYDGRTLLQSISDAAREANRREIARDMEIYRREFVRAPYHRLAEDW